MAATQEWTYCVPMRLSKHKWREESGLCCSLPLPSPELDTPNSLERQR